MALLPDTTLTCALAPSPGINLPMANYFLLLSVPSVAVGAPRRTEDGVSATVCINDGDTHNGPCEQTEAKYPLLFECHALIPDSGGAGEYRGGLGVECVIQTRAEITLNTSIERKNCLPWGLRRRFGRSRQRGATSPR